MTRSHYIKDRKSFDETAQYWAENYACGDNPKIDPIELYGLDRESVSDFENMGFTQEKVIEAMRSLNIRNAQGREQEKVLEILLKESSS
ncbi:Ubiquitin-conjugating enzyme E2 1 [Neolecta irregularis DAH-3]|uniref:Ubiquitin-conjugating enzyme E2 1 n=1 Tax=Neolecta irregularis (strain DAH-3) TaxID=1198029 RepID=A0A1U7LW82_NEOID|nr:Ubiquitin-conjugating enzyme E2 1 [Neolecta irregularis DAH-3]|eukprot:OLL26940.1 Ubiquitin-conjugating enzyme E2 1 [Neolecta irregularis DAH-3]